MSQRMSRHLYFGQVLEWADLPSRVGTPAAAGARSASSEPQPPAHLRVAKRVPDVAGKSSASLVVRNFERVVVIPVKGEDGSATREEIFSPMRLWTTAVRAANPPEKGQSTRFSALCRIYLYVRVGLKVAPDSVEDSYGKLRDAAGKWWKDAAGEEGEEGGLFERALQAYQQSV